MLFVIVVIAGVLVFRSPELPPIEVLAATSLPSPPQGIFARVVPISWGWAWRLRQAVLGKPRRISLNTSIIDLSGVTNESWETALAIPPTLAGTNGLRIWISENETLETLRQSWASGKRVLASPRTISADGVGVSQSMTTPVLVGAKQTEAGVFLEYRPRVSPDSADLMALIRMTQAMTNQVSGEISIQTNLNVATRLQLPKGKGAFIFCDTVENNEPSFGILIFSAIGK